MDTHLSVACWCRCLFLSTLELHVKLDKFFTYRTPSTLLWLLPRYSSANSCIDLYLSKFRVGILGILISLCTNCQWQDCEILDVRILVHSDVNLSGIG